MFYIYAKNPLLVISSASSNIKIFILFANKIFFYNKYKIRPGVPTTICYPLYNSILF